MVDDRAKQLSVVLRREVAKIRSLEAECIEANKATIFSGVSMTVNLQHAQIKYSSLAQLAERMTVNHDVAGSSPAGGAKQNPLSKEGGFLFVLFIFHYSSFIIH